MLNNEKTLRDEFAIAALAAISNIEQSDIDLPKELAKMYYKVADAILKERKINEIK